MNEVDEYLKNVDPKQREELERVRETVRKTVPDAVESISYGMPAFKYKNQPLVYYAAFKDHMSLFPTSGPTEVLKDKLKDYTLSKGTIQFTLEQPLSESLIKEVLAARLDQIG